MTFIGDQGRDYLAAKDMIITGNWPLVGIPSSVPWLHQGPFFIWLTALALKLGNFNPLTPAIFTALLGVLTVYLIYHLSLNWFSKKTSLIASLLTATSPLIVIHSRMPYHISPIPLVSLLYIFSLYFYYKNKLNLFWPVFLWAVLLQLELTALPLILLVFLIWIFKKITPSKNHIFTLILASAIPLLPKIIYDFSHGFKQTFGLIAWGGYRFLSFFGFLGEHTVSTTSLKTVSLTIFNFWQKFLIYNSSLIALLTILLVIFALYKKFKKHKKISIDLKLLLIFTLLNFLGFYLHQGPSEAYFPILFPAWALLIAWAIQSLKQPFIYFLFILLSIYNAFFLVKHDFKPYGPTLNQRQALVSFLTTKHPDNNFKIINYPSVNQFPSYLDNYRYLIWQSGHHETKTSQNIYTIYDGDLSEINLPSASTTYHFENQLLIRTHD